MALFNTIYAFKLSSLAMYNIPIITAMPLVIIASDLVAYLVMQLNTLL